MKITKNIKLTTIYLLTLSLALGTLNSCVKDTDADSLYLSEYQDTDVQSYSDLFEIFWKVMSQRYCYFNEQTGDFSLNWNDVYNEYKPKFDQLKTWNHSYEWTNEEINADSKLAQQYFQNITSQIRDQHFVMAVTVPTSHVTSATIDCCGHQEVRTAFPLKYHFIDVLRKRDDSQEKFAWKINDGEFYICGHFLKDQPDIYYLAFSGFDLTVHCNYAFKENYLPNAEKGITISDKALADYAEKVHLAQAADGKQALTAINERIQQINNYLKSDEVKNVIAHMEAYRSQKDGMGLVKAINDAYEACPYKTIQKNSNGQYSAEQYWAVDCEYYANMRNWSKEASNFIVQVSFDIYKVLNEQVEFCSFLNDINSNKDNELLEQYATQFLAPLKQGKIKKLILDLRGNGGGYLHDSFLLTNYLVSHDAIYASAREKEGAAPFSYTPWVDQVFKKTKESLDRDIPTSVLIDYGSMSMSEMTSLILKSQGNHVTLIGQNSRGGQCRLGPDMSNSGYCESYVTPYLFFYMPQIALRDTQGRVLEGIGLTPDVYVEPFTDEEIAHFEQDDQTVTDRALDKAIEVLKSK